MKNFQNKNIGIFGLGKTGLSCYEYLKNEANIICGDDFFKKKAQNASIKVSNLVDINDKRWRNLDFIVLSPGIPTSHPIVSIARQNNVKILSDIEILYLNNKKSRYVVVTGTNGKSTVTSLIGHITGIQIGGNIGTPCLNLNKLNSYVLELSSFQLDLLSDFRIDIGVLLKITPDHLDRYESFENYVNSKKKMLNFMDNNSTFVVSADNQQTIKTKIPSIPISCTNNLKNGIYVTQDKIFDNIDGITIELNTKLKGKHNLENIAASYAACKAYGMNPKDITSAIGSFEGLAHRMQFVGSFTPNNKNRSLIAFYNDSKATNAESSGKALSSLNNIYWLAGGVPKSGGIASIKDLMHKVRKAYFFGKARVLFANTILEQTQVETFETMDQAFNKAVLDALKDDFDANVLLSPACASYDQFCNFEERGNHFIQLVKNYL